MKRQIQLRGERDWAGEDLIDLQKEPLKVLDSFFAAYNPCIINGCKIVESGSLFNITSGYVSLKGNGIDGNNTSMVVPFAGVTSVSLPIYLTLKCDVVNDVYGDGATKPIAYNYYAGYSAAKPSSEYLEISNSIKCRFTDVIQLAGSGYFMTLLEKFKLSAIESGANKYIHPDNSSTRHVTDSEKSEWNSKASKAIATTALNGLMSSTDKIKLNEMASGVNNYIHPNNSETRHVTDSEKTAWNNKASTALATASINGLMAAADKSKLDSIAAGANKYVHPIDSNSRHMTDAEKTKLGRMDMIIGRCAYTDNSYKALNISKHRGDFSITEINRTPESSFVGSYRITHNLGHANYLVDLYYDSLKFGDISLAPYQARYNNYVDVSFCTINPSSVDSHPLRTEFSFKITVF